jgi:hypothetical protein
MLRVHQDEVLMRSEVSEYINNSNAESFRLRPLEYREAEAFHPLLDFSERKRVGTVARASGMKAGREQARGSQKPETGT